MQATDNNLVDGLTPKQLQVLRHIADFQGNRCYSPTIADLASALSLSRSTVFEHLGELQRKSLLTTSPGRARSLKLTPRGRRVLEHAQVEEPETDDPAVVGVPLLGTRGRGPAQRSG